MNIRQTLTLYSSISVIMLVCTCLFSLELVNKFTNLKQIMEREHLLMSLGNELRISSFRLTRAVREFVITQNPDTEQYYYTILAMRDGEKARRSAAPIAPGETIALVELLRRSGATPEELTLFSAAKERSDELAKLEIEAIQRTKGVFKDAQGAFTIHGEPDPESAKALVFSESYQKTSSEIISMVSDFVTTMINRSADQTALETNELHRNLRIIFLFLLVILCTALASAWYGFRKISQPLTLTMNFAKKLDTEHITFNIDLPANNEIGQLCRVLNKMVDTIRCNTEMLEKLSYCDELTRLYNRRRFQELLNERLRLVCSQKRRLALGMFDLDSFKRVNDTYGHPVGDKVLKAFADLLRRSGRGADIVARFGGEEFVLVLADTGKTNPFFFFDDIRKRCAGLSVVNKKTHIRFTVSIGVCVYDAAIEGPVALETLIERADQALYCAKARGRNQVVLWKDNEYCA